MSTFRVEDVRENQPDSTGAAIVEVFSRVPPRFAVYRTARRMMIQFADNGIEASMQRAALIPIEPLRSEVEGLIDVLRSEQSEFQQIKLRGYEDSFSKALRVALQGDLVRSEKMLNKIKDDIVEDRASDIRTFHLLYSAAATLALILISRILASDWFGNAFGRFDSEVAAYYWTAAAVGAVGAFFSISLAIRARTVPVDLQPWDNVTDAVLRIFVGATSAVILIALLRTGLVTVTFGAQNLTDGIHGIVLAAFIGGFTERLVSEFLSGFALASKGKPTEATAKAPAAHANEREVTGEADKDRPAQPANDQGTIKDETEEAQPLGEEAIEPDEEEIEPGVPGHAQEEKLAVG